MNIPSMVYGDLLDDKGQMSEIWMSDINQVFSQLQRNLSDEGYNLPAQPTSNINQLTSEKSYNALLVDSTTGELKINIAGTWHVIPYI